MTEELITDLSQVAALKVISRTSSEVYGNKHAPLPQIARELNVDAIVEGSVQRSEGQVRITAQLIYAPEDRNIWAHTYVRDAQSALTLQSEVAAAIVDQVEHTLSPQHPLARHTNAGTTNPDAYDLYLKGRYYWNQRTEADFWKGIESFRQAIEKDPNYAQAYAGLADCYILLGPNDVLPAKEVYPLARTAALRALQLDDTLAEAHASLGFVRLLYDWNPIQAEKEFRRAIELNPNYPTAHHWYAYDLVAMKRSDEAIAEIRRALELDPVSPIINTDVGQILLLARHPDEAIAQCQKAISLDAQFPQVYWYLGLLYEQKGIFDQAFEAFLKAPPGFSNSPPDASIRAAYRVSGIRGYWRERLSSLGRQSQEHYVSPFTLAVPYARLGEVDRALENLGRALDERYPSMVFLQVEPVFDSLRSDPRFEELLERVAQSAK
jgi:tetratricopeptide (TPR) repeat protein